ncbi:ABC-three component system middle component 2 [Rathayibacter sp. VKM Ac-2927]|uniref:ABC-three component system middle component 2 n=1 Tax=Rathayibacter sp. VKM Ac-2927 TaxID=2929478 RepID=UPI001FB1FB43|nr:ABC-three component system middle component 2 [Rathayibacter sp. VKM Ac-2927]MCJ1688632.1 hypothetical protein [Rathayibacter sp. VKM Ac-2927]
MTEVLNGPLEIGLRLLIILDEVDARSWTVDDVLVLDHMTIHSYDFSGPASLHPAFPLRSADVGARRAAVRQGLELLAHKGLVHIELAPTGIFFTSSEQAHSVAALLESNYAHAVRSRARWLSERLLDDDNFDLEAQIGKIVELWPEEADLT